MRLGIYGGTFDPPHNGHLILAAEALDQLRLDKVIWTVTADPPHKQNHVLSPADLRLQLVHAALADNPAFELSRVEIDRPGPHYTVDTVRILREQYPEDEIYYLIGGDSLRDMVTWQTPVELTRLVTGFGVMHRPVVVFDLASLEREIPGLTAKVQFIRSPLVEISASMIRERVAMGQPYRYFVPAAVYQLIEGLGIYRLPAFFEEEI